MRPVPVSSFPFFTLPKNFAFFTTKKILLFALVILLIAFARDTPPYPLSMDGGTDGGSTERTAMRAGKELASPPHTLFFHCVRQCEEGGRGDRLHQD